MKIFNLRTPRPTCRPSDTKDPKAPLRQAVRLCVLAMLAVTSLARGIKRRPQCRTFLLLAAIASALALTHYLALTVYMYREYVYALLLPSPALPMQRRPPPIRGDEGRPSEANGGESKGEYKLGDGINVGGEGQEGHLPRVLCLIVTSPKYHKTRASHVAATWARHCTRAVFLSSAADPLLPEVVVTSGAVSYEQLWGKVTQGFEWAYHRIHDFDWVVKADDDSFLLVENLQAALSHHPPHHPLATGVHIKTWGTESTYLNGGAGYVLSSTAVRLLVEEGLRDRQCTDHLTLGTNEDVNMALCLQHLGVTFLDSRDGLGRQRFHMYSPQEVMDPRQADSLTHLWLKRQSVFPYKFGYAELSDRPISFHYVDPSTMYLLYYLVYFVNPHNQHVAPPPSLPSPAHPSQVAKLMQ